MSAPDTPPPWFRDAMHLPRSEITALYDHEMPREPGWREGPNLERQSDYAWALEHFGHASELMDPGIIRVVRIFTEHKIETCQSCQGGEGHAYTRPSVDLTYQPWEALGVASHYGIPVTRISHIWNVDPDSDEPHDSPSGGSSSARTVSRGFATAGTTKRRLTARSTPRGLQHMRSTPMPDLAATVANPEDQP